MKKTVLSCVFAALALTFQAQISISPTNTQPHASAMLDVQSTNKGMLVPRMTTAQRNAINNPAKGLMVFDNTTNSFWYHNGTAWAAVGGADVPASGIVFSEIAVNANLSAAGFSLIGQTQMVLTGSANSNNFAWSGQTSPNGAPSPRSGHSAIWTGTEMIIWGGNSGQTSVKSGGRYNPTTDSWVQTDTTTSPSARSGHFVVWTGTEMIIWGRNGAGAYLYDGKKYNPTSNIWTTISSTNAPTWVAKSAIWTGTEVIFWGGTTILPNGQGQCINAGKKYNPISNTWSDISSTNAPDCKHNFSTIWTGVEMILWGGGTAMGLTNSGHKYNPTTDTWTTITSINAPDARSHHTAVWTGAEMIVVAGFATYPLTSGGRYNPTSDSWSAMTNSNIISWSISSGFWTGNDVAVVYEDDGDLLEVKSEIFNPSTNMWSPIIDDFYPPPSRRWSFSTTMCSDKIIIWGGSTSNFLTNRGYILSPAELKTLYLFIKN